MTEITAAEDPPATPPVPPTEKEEGVPILSVPIKDQDTALKLMVQFLEIANRRGAFSIAESSKIHQCVKMFIPAEDKK